jgi:hypothetical protein
MATSWNRALSLIYTDLKWLNAFSQLNRIAINKTVSRMAKNYLEIQDNVIDKRMILNAIEIWGPTFMPENQT